MAAWIFDGAESGHTSETRSASSALATPLNPMTPAIISKIKLNRHQFLSSNRKSHWDIFFVFITASSFVRIREPFSVLILL
jgi:hypothetical protein